MFSLVSHSVWRIQLNNNPQKEPPKYMVIYAVIIYSYRGHYIGMSRVVSRFYWRLPDRHGEAIVRLYDLLYVFNYAFVVILDTICKFTVDMYCMYIHICL